MHAVFWLVGSIVVNEVLYDPPGPDAGREFVELLNIGSEPVPARELVLEAGDGARPGTWRLVWQGSAAGTLVPGVPWLVSGDSLASPERLAADLQNGPDALRLGRGGVVLDRLGYGALADPDLFEGTPAADVAGASLARRPDGVDTDDNGRDFAPAPPTPGRLNVARRDLAVVLHEPDPTTAWPGRLLRAAIAVGNRGRERLEEGGWSAKAQLVPLGSESAAPPHGVELRGVGKALDPGDSLEIEARWMASLGVFVLEVRLEPADDDSTNDRSRVPVRVGAGAVVVNEIHFAPAAGETEWVELWNRDARAHEIDGWTLADATGRPGRLAAPTALPPDAYALLVADPQTPIAGAEPGALRVEVAPWNSLNNTDDASGTADAVVLRDGGGVVVDAVRYAAAWGREPHRSLERLSPDVDAHGSHWAPCPHPGRGTPGRANAAQLPQGGSGALEMTPNPFSPDGDGRDDQLGTTIQVPDGYEGFQLRVFDLEGRERARLGGDRLGPGRRLLPWDGRDQAGTILPIGFYIVDLELYSKSGPRLRARRVLGLVR